MKKRKIWIILIVTEIIYILSATALSVKFKESPFYSELYKTIFRIVSLIIYSIIFKKSFILENRIIPRSKYKSSLIVVAVLFLFSFPVLFGKSGFTRPLRILWFLSSFIVGFREEIFYRGIIQTSLNKKYNIIVTIIFTSIIFMLYHVYVFIYGSWIDLIEIFIWSFVIGIIYFKIRSIIIVSVIHGLYDAIPFITPVFLKSVNYKIGILLLVFSLFLVAIPVLGKNRKET